MKQEGISLFHLNHRIKNVLKNEFDSEVWVVAEISELRYNQNGHCYLELIEKDKESNQITAKARATIWSYTFRMLKPYFETTTGQKFTSGIKVLIQASIEFQEIYGYTLNIKDIDPNYTLGDLARKRKKILARLKQEGVLEMNKELDFPEIPKTIAIISSPTAAGYEDFVKQLENNNNNYQFHYKLFPAIMQGNQAEESIIQALDRINEFENIFDTVAILRGGGSQADLNCFDNYWLALNVAQFPLPIISGIGHERDESIVDIVAHTRVKTPTAAAEFLIDCFDSRREFHENLQEEFLSLIHETLLEQSEKIHSFSNRFTPMVKQIIQDKNNRLLLAKEKLKSCSKQTFADQKYDLQKHETAILHLTEGKINTQKQKINHLQSKIGVRVKHLLENQKNKLTLSEKTIQFLNPINVLQKGYTLTLKDGKIVKDLSQLSKNDKIETQFKNGSLESIVINRRSKK
jgi:exodeoxyribonuclease VII large subunit